MNECATLREKFSMMKYVITVGNAASCAGLVILFPVI
jgi:hypothetical protein